MTLIENDLRAERCKMQQISSTITFYKYSATGNDFIIIDAREQAALIASSPKQIQALCSRRTGIGADGILFLQTASDNQLDYKMRYFNADGGEVAMCGNGARALAHCAYFYFAIKPYCNQTFKFENISGVYQCSIGEYNDAPCLEMTQINDENLFSAAQLIELLTSQIALKNAYYVDTGVPHIVYEVAMTILANIDVKRLGQQVRDNSLFSAGVNVNFIERVSDHCLKMRTYERGVEDETLSCGTGALAAALYLKTEVKNATTIKVIVAGGELELIFNASSPYLKGAAEKIYRGELNWPND